MKIKVAHLITALGIGGAEQMVLQLASKLDKKTFETHVFCMKGRGEIGEKLIENGVVVHYLDFNAVWDFPKSMVRFYRQMKRFRPDVLVTHLFHADVFGRLSAYMLGIKKNIVYRHGPDLRWGFLRRIDRWTQSRVSKYLVVSNWLKRDLLHQGFDENKIQLFPNSVEVDRFYPIPIEAQKKLRTALNLSEEMVVFGIVASLKKGKGHPELLDAMKHLSAHLLIIGEGEERSFLEKKVHALNLEKHVVFLGLRQDVPQLLSVIDVFVLPTHFEGMSVALLQAMAAKKAILTTDIEANRDLVIQNESALLTPVQNTAKLALAMQRLIDDPQLRERLSKNAHLRCIDHFSLDQTVHAFEKILKTI